MVVLQRNEVRRHRLVFFLTVILSVITLIAIVRNLSDGSQPAQLGLVLLGAAAVVALLLSLLQFYTLPKRSEVLLFQNDDEIVIATNALHEGFKLRFLRD